MLQVAAAAALAAAPLLYMYADAKLHLHKDLRPLLGRARIRRAFARAARADRLSPYYFVAANAAKQDLAAREAIWYRDPSGRVTSYSWAEALQRSHQFAWWFLAKGVKRGDLVGFYMLNSADFVFAWVGLWAIGAAPAMVNYYLRGDALVHCLEVSGARLVLVDGDAAAEGRIREVSQGRRTTITTTATGDGPVRGQAVGGREVEFVRLEDARLEVYAMKTDVPGDEFRKGIKGTDPMALFFTSGTTGMPKGCTLPVVAAFGHGYGTVAGTNPVEGMDERYCKCFLDSTGSSWDASGWVLLIAIQMSACRITMAQGGSMSWLVSRYWYQTLQQATARSPRIASANKPQN